MYIQPRSSIVSSPLRRLNREPGVSRLWGLSIRRAYTEQSFCPDNVQGASIDPLSDAWALNDKKRGRPSRRVVIALRDWTTPDAASSAA
jgi:hypothetical protein